MIESKDKLGGEKILPGRTFHFACGPDLACFNSCCKNKRLPLWPYDLLRLRRGLGLTSDRILESLVELEMDPNSGWPALRIKLDEQGGCPFVSPEGCRVYEHRPACCRIFPLARAAAPSSAGGAPEVVFLKQETTGCLGWDQSREHTVETWSGDQELEAYHLYNDRLLPLFFHPKRRGRLKLTPPQIHAVIAALYNLDVFRKMVDQPGFRKRFDPERIERSLTDDEELLQVGADFLAAELFG